MDLFGKFGKGITAPTQIGQPVSFYQTEIPLQSSFQPFKFYPGKITR